MERFSFVTPVTGLNRPNTGKEDDEIPVPKHFIDLNADVHPCISK
jgi:hypothetical protein